MMRKDGGTTSPVLLKRVADWMDHPAWSEFFKVYDPLIRLWSGGYGLDDGTFEDLCQQIWIELAGRMRTYQYDPGRMFRGWLRQLCHSRAIDMHRKRRTEPVRSLDDQPDAALLLAVDRIAGGDDGATCSLLLRQGAQVQDAVKRRVEPQTWRAFWRVAVEGRSLRETADEIEMSYAAVFAAHKRVGRMLRAEGLRLLAETPRPES